MLVQPTDLVESVVASTDLQPASEPDRPFHILVVDDEPDLEPLMRQRFRRKVRRGDYVLHFAANGVEALDVVRSDTRVDMVVTDINMPRMNGLQLLAALPEVDPDLRSIVVSAYGDMDNIRTAMNRGAFDFVVKPVDFDDLSVTLERARAHVARWKEAVAARDRLTALQSELRFASNLQQAILPVRFPSGPTFDVHARMVAARDVAGDFYDVVALDGDRHGLAVADVSGKGVPAALFMMSARSLLKGASIGTDVPVRVLAEVNALLHADNPNWMFVSVLYLVYDPASGGYTYASGGHCPALLIGADGRAVLADPPVGVVLGLSDEVRFDSASGTLAPGETILLYSDGVYDAVTPDGEAFGLERLCALFSGEAPRSAEEATRRVFDALDEFSSGATQADDITCLALHRRSR